MLLLETTPDATCLGGGGVLLQSAKPRLPLLPDAIQAGQRDFFSMDPLHERQRPQLQQRRPAGQRLADLTERADLRRSQQQEPVTLLPVRQKLDRIQKPGLLLDLVQNHQAIAVIQYPWRCKISRKICNDNENIPRGGSGFPQLARAGSGGEAGRYTRGTRGPMRQRIS